MMNEKKAQAWDNIADGYVSWRATKAIAEGMGLPVPKWVIEAEKKEKQSMDEYIINMTESNCGGGWEFSQKPIQAKSKRKKNMTVEETVVEIMNLIMSAKIEVVSHPETYKPIVREKLEVMESNATSLLKKLSNGGYIKKKPANSTVYRGEN